MAKRKKKNELPLVVRVIQTIIKPIYHVAMYTQEEDGFTKAVKKAEKKYGTKLD